MRIRITLEFASLSWFSDTALPAQESQIDRPTPIERTPVYRVRVAARSTSTVNYRNPSGFTELKFCGTDLMPATEGKAEAER